MNIKYPALLHKLFFYYHQIMSDPILEFRIHMEIFFSASDLDSANYITNSKIRIQDFFFKEVSKDIPPKFI